MEKRKVKCHQQDMDRERSGCEAITVKENEM